MASGAGAVRPGDDTARLGALAASPATPPHVTNSALANPTYLSYYTQIHKSEYNYISFIIIIYIESVCIDRVH